MMGRSPRLYIPSFVEIGPPVLEKKICEGFYHIYGHGGDLGHVTWTICTKFGSPSQGGSAKNLASIGKVVLEENIFDK